MPESLRRLLWFAAYWLLGVATLAVIAFAIRAVLF
jgi:hypothetical protein